MQGDRLMAHEIVSSLEARRNRVRVGRWRCHELCLQIFVSGATRGWRYRVEEDVRRTDPQTSLVPTLPISATLNQTAL